MQFIPYGIYLITEQCEIIHLNATAKKYVKVCKRYQGKKLTNIIENSDILEAFEELTKKMSQPNYLEFSTNREQIKNMNISIFPLKVSSAAKIKKEALVLIFNTTTLKEKYQKESKRNAISSLNFLMASIAHKIKNPLDSLDLHLQLINRFAEKKNRKQRRIFRIGCCGT